MHETIIWYYNHYVIYAWDQWYEQYVIFLLIFNIFNWTYMKKFEELQIKIEK